MRIVDCPLCGTKNALKALDDFEEATKIADEVITDVLMRNIDVSREMLKGPGRYQSIVGPRHEVMWMMRQRGLPLKVIGTFLNRDHSTVIHGIQEWERYLRGERLYPVAVAGA